jgi:hypothetical protein
MEEVTKCAWCGMELPKALYPHQAVKHEETGNYYCIDPCWKWFTGTMKILLEG